MARKSDHTPPWWVDLLGAAGFAALCWLVAWVSQNPVPW
jgi:hypothetical protein